MEQQRSSKPENPNLLLEEYKILVEDRRFLMTRYTQGLALYLALMGVALRLLIDVETHLIYVFAFFLTAANILAAIMANRFKSMALHVIKRETFIARILGMQEPHSMLWGYWVGLSAFGLAQLGLIGIVLVQFITDMGIKIQF